MFISYAFFNLKENVKVMLHLSSVIILKKEFKYVVHKWYFGSQVSVRLDGQTITNIWAVSLIYIENINILMKIINDSWGLMNSIYGYNSVLISIPENTKLLSLIIILNRKIVLTVSLQDALLKLKCIPITEK